MFKLNNWIILFFFSLPCLFLSQIPHVISIMYFIFFGFYFLHLFRNKIFFYVDGFQYIRNQIECIFFLIILLIEVTNLRSFSDLVNQFKSLYFLIFFLLFDISLGFHRAVLNNKLPTNKFKIFYTFISFLIPPLGVFYLKRMYNTNR